MADDMDVEIQNNTNGPGTQESENEYSSDDRSEKDNKGSASPVYDDDDGTICPICLDAWTNSGAHRICCLKCGHLFGHQCLLRWLDSQTKKSCPTCKKPVKRSDLRLIYAKKLVAVDNIELENMRQQLEEAVMQKNTALQSVAKYISRERVLQQEIDHLKKKIQDLTFGSRSAESRLILQSPLSRVRLYLEKNVEVCTKGGCRDCRSFDVSIKNDLILISSRSPTDLFGGFGLKKLSLTNYKPIKFIPLHKNSIKDMSLHPSDNKVLTVSTDKKFRVTDTQSTMTILTVSLDSVPWACGWNPRDDDELFIGSQNGSVCIYDIRNLHSPKNTFNFEGDFSPIVSLTGIKNDNGLDLLLVAKLNSVWAIENHPGGNYNRYLLPLDGPFLSLNYDRGSRQLLVSSRPNSQTPYARHTVCYLERKNDPETVTSNVVHTFKGGSTVKFLAKTSCFIPNNIVAGHHETKRSILLYSMNTGEEIGSCPTHDNSVFDIKGFNSPSGKFLAYLNEKKLEFFKFNQT
ncbi:mutagen-sensitive 302 isoform X2 [Rhynchophorus ferrugineus]|uniref:mutagen-sensitive 302 isoform X2 n=1 Tax=Rhynchophorus ferrugineus TaxID=354439 RepID=UPI003FCCD35A